MTTVVEAAIARYEMPEDLRSDNGPEFIASCMQDWLRVQAIKRSTSSREALGKTGILRAFTTSFAMNA